MAKYHDVVRHIEEQREKGLLAAGDRLPSLRTLAARMNLGLNTVIRGYQELEAEGMIQARDRSGYVIREHTAGFDPAPRQPEFVDVMSMARDVMTQAANPALLPLGSAHPSTEFPAVRALYSELSRASREQPALRSHYQIPPGHADLRKQLAKISLDDGLMLSPDEIQITQGAQQAISISLQSVTMPGDIVLVNGPCYFGTLLSLEALKLRVIEVPCDPVSGMDIAALKDAMAQWPVKALLVNATLNNPAGYSLGEENRRAILAATGDLPIIEDDCFSLLSLENHPPTFKSLDTLNRVLYCTSLSKCLDSRIRIGWVAAGRYQKEVERRLLLTGLGGVNLIQAGLARFLAKGHFRRHLDKIRRSYLSRAQSIRRQLSDRLGWQARFNRFEGGYLLWLTLPPGTNGERIYFDALEEGISTTPGSIFSTTNLYDHHIRLNVAHYQEGPKWRDCLTRLGTVIERNIPA